ncbi:MAG: FAD-dependent oxidoreductase, partial [Dehalococcoidia bacterium]|nr:FAD-dependent oxidoreductase [Dehalococcoidia bacterium]
PDALVLATGGKLSPLRRLAEMAAAMVVFFRYRDALKKDWILRDRAERIQLVGPHTVMLAASRPDLELLKEVGGAVSEVHVVGDCREPFGIMSAMADGARVGRVL